MPTFSYQIRISDINYGQHLAHDRLISLLHDARTRMLAAVNQSELNFFGAGLILRQLNVKYLSQAFLHEQVAIQITPTSIENRKLELYYEVTREGDKKYIAQATTEMVYFDYQLKKSTALAVEPILKQLGGN